MNQPGSGNTSPHFNVIKDERGSIIPPTQRPDGTWRKPIRVKEGYVPQEEIPLYESKGKQWANRTNQYPIGYSPLAYAQAQDTSKPYIPGLVIEEESTKKTKSKKKSATNGEQKSNESIKKEKPAQTQSVGAQSNNSKPGKKSKSKAGESKKEEKSAPTVTPVDSEGDSKKKLRNLKKKLKEIEAIEEKIKIGGSKSVDADQRKKVSRKAELLRDILSLQQLSLND